MQVGLRVVRGKDWKWGDQDGGQGSVGTVVEVGGQGGKNPKNTVVVVWDTGAKANYRAGHQGANDLKVLDSAAAGIRHSSVNCDICKESGLIGTRWKCEVCHDFDLCHACYMGAKHDLSHAFKRFDTALSYGVQVPPRAGSRRVPSIGTYPGARVVRGSNWNYKNQDGGPDKQGVIQTVSGSSDGVSWRSWIKVKWDVGGANDYRRGHEGKVDVKCVKFAPGEIYYVDHLACLADYASCAFSAGDRVKLDERQLSASDKLQMAQFLGKVGKVIISKEGEKVHVQYPGDDGAYRLPTSYLMKESACLMAQIFRKGDTVMISSDQQTVVRLQQGHGGWNDQMKSCLGMEAEVLGTDSDGDVKVAVNGKKWIFCPEACTLISRGSEDTDDDDDDDAGDDDDDNDEVSNLGNAFLGLFLKAVLEQAASPRLGPEHLVKMAAEGNLNAVKSIIQNHSAQVDLKVKDMTALQVAAHQGHLQVVIALANAGARLDMQDGNGDNVLHFATIGGQPEVLEVLAKHKPNLVNAPNNEKRTCLHLAVIKQDPRCLQVLLKYNADVNLQDKDGDTALHVAVEKPDVAIQDQLIDHPKADFRLKNGKDFNVIHLATLKNNVNALKKLVQKAPTLVNIVKSDSFTALHIATINGFRNAAEVLITTGRANLNMKNISGFTPLLLAVNQGRASMIELLVSKGADINAEDKDGDTALHLAASSIRLSAPSVSDGLFAFAILNVFLEAKQPKDLQAAPIISKIISELPSTLHQQHRAWIAICCFLLQNGAQMDKANHGGKSVDNMIGDNNLKQILRRYTKPIVQPRPAPVPTPRPVSASVSPPPTPISRKCMMCLTADADMTFHPCGHKVTCGQCSGRMKTCFSCHERIQEKVRSSVTEHAPAPDVLRARKEPLSNNMPSPDALRRNKMTTDSVNCPLCETRVRNVVFLCGHSCCKECSDPLTSCHVCDQTIARKLTLM